MDFSLTSAEKDFKDEVETWLNENLTGEFGDLKGKGGTGRNDIAPELLMAWEAKLAEGGWLGINYPTEWGGRNCTLFEQVIFYMTYVEFKAPGRIPNMGLTLAGPTIVDYGTQEQKKRFLPSILNGTEFWCQGYSEPDAGSDLANIRTRAELTGDSWVINGQKIWTSLAQFSDWCFVVCRTDSDSARHSGLSYLLVPMSAEGIEIRPIIQITGGDEFNEVFFNDVRIDKELIVGEPGHGWAVAMATLGYERGASTLGQQLSFRQEFEDFLAEVDISALPPKIRQDLAQAYEQLEIMRFNNMRILSAMADGVPGAEASIAKLYWSEWHKNLGELMMSVLGAEALATDNIAENGEELEKNGLKSTILSKWQETFLYSRAHTIYAGTSEIQRTIIGEKALGLPRESKGK